MMRTAFIYVPMTESSEFLHRESEISIGERLVLQREMPPFLTDGLEAVTQHGLTQYHAIMELFGGDTVIGLVFPRVGVAAKVGMALLSEPVESAAHVHFLFRGHVEQGKVDGRATGVAALLGDIAQLEELVARHIGIEIRPHERVVDIGGPTHKVVDGTLRPIRVKYLQSIALFLQVVAHGTKAVGSLTREQGDRLKIAVHTSANKVIGAVVTDLQDGIGDDIGNVHELAGIVGRRQCSHQPLELGLGLGKLFEESGAGVQACHADGSTESTCIHIALPMGAHDDAAEQGLCSDVILII